MTATHPIRIRLPAHLRNLTGVDGEICLEVASDGEPSVTDLLDALEARYPALRGTVRDHATGRRRDYMRYFACGRDLSHDPPDRPLPEAVTAGEEPFRVVGAIAGGTGPTPPDGGGAPDVREEGGVGFGPAERSPARA